MPVVKVAFSVDDSYKSIEAMLKGLQPVWPGRTLSGSITFDFRDCGHLGPAAVALLFAMFADLDRRGLAWTFQPPTLAKLYGYCQFSGLLERTKSGPPAEKSHPKSVTIPVRNFKVYDYDGIEAVVSLVKKFINMSADTASVLRVSISELVYNVLDHAVAADGGYISARAFANEADVRFVVLDLGRGIREALSAKHPEIKTDQEAVEAAFRERTSSQSRPRNRGLGLHSLSEAVRHNGGDMALFSFTGVAERSKSHALRYHTVEALFPGTLALVRFRIDNTIYGGDSAPVDDIEI